MKMSDIGTNGKTFENYVSDILDKLFYQLQIINLLQLEDSSLKSFIFNFIINRYDKNLSLYLVRCEEKDFLPIDLANYIKTIYFDKWSRIVKNNKLDFKLNLNKSRKLKTTTISNVEDTREVEDNLTADKSITGTAQDKVGIKITDSGLEDLNYFGFNSTKASPTNKNNTENVRVGDKEDNTSDTTYEDKTIDSKNSNRSESGTNKRETTFDYTDDVEGNPLDYLDKDNEYITKYNILKIIEEDLDSVLFSSIYYR